MDKNVITLDLEAQSKIAANLRRLADFIEAGAIQVTDLYASINMIDTTPEGAQSLTCEPDMTSHVLLLRFAKQETQMQAASATESEGRPATGKTLEQYFKDAFARGVIDHALRALVDESDRVSFYIHPANADGETCDYEVRNNLTRPDPRVTRQD